MTGYFLFTLFLLFAFCATTVAQLCTLNANYDPHASKVFLYWNMINGTDKTTYVLSKSNDKKNWTLVVTDKIFKQYTAEDTFDYADKINPDKECYYRLKIINANRETVTYSNIVAVNNTIEKSIWEIYPNPVNDILYLVCKGSSIIKGVINVLIYDVTGKIVTRFRSASIYRSLQIPVSHLRNGIFVVEISILNEIACKKEFIKQ